MRIKDIKILSSLVLMITLILSSCRDETFSDFWDGSDEFTVTINVGLEGMDHATREGETQRHIGDASKIDMLVYAVYYDKNKNPENPDWQAATEYVKKDDEGNPKSDFDNIEPGHGQTVLNVSGTLNEGLKKPITLTLKKGQEYKVVFWAQNHETEAFVIDDLKKVQMKYKVLHPEKQGSSEEEGTEDESAENEDEIRSVNNDESRDAFCRSVTLNGNQSNRNITIYLKRPLAQINVGTRGFDYESITRNSKKGNQFLYSKIRINRAARYLNVVTDEIYTTTIEDPSGSSTEAFYTIDYEYSKIPAYWNMELPEYPSYTIYDYENRNDAERPSAYNAFMQKYSESYNEDEYKKTYANEEFLKVHLFRHTEEENNNFGDGQEFDYIPYEGMGASLNTNEGEQNRSEIFKYLSMCYVLTNSSDEYQDVLTNVKVWIATSENPTGEGDEVEILNLTNVPVQRNHRTNVVGSLLTAKADMQIIVDEDFAGRKIGEGSDLVSGEITEGFYYDAGANEFQISSLNGLLFFQQLVNGNLLVRQVSNNNSAGTTGIAYPYYDPEDPEGDNTLRLKYKSYTYDELGEDKAQIIIKGSGYDKFENGVHTVTVGGKTWNIKVDKDENGWPKNNNFPFYGATVKLMADIDLFGIEWIPIGFDCANWDSTFGAYKNGYTKDSNGKYKYTDKGDLTINYIALTSPDAGKNEIELGNRRAFCGTFDGNGHTIYNLYTKRFGAKVHDEALQDYGEESSGANQGGPYDCVQWFEKGFFGVAGPGVVIKNLRLQNIDVQGNNGVGGIVAQVSSIGFPAKIQNCVVDGGVIDAVPIYRGDKNTVNFYGRTGARGCYIGGIVGQFCAKDNGTDIAEISGCEVRNITIQAYRRMGGIVGSIADQGASDMGTEDIQVDIAIKNNSVVNSKLIVNQYRPFNFFWDHMGNNGSNNDVWLNGFGWGSGATYTPMSNVIVGGYYHTANEKALATLDEYYTFESAKYTRKTIKSKDDYYQRVENSWNNRVSNLQYTELAVSPDKLNKFDGIRNASYRQSLIGNVPMANIPMFTSIYVDKVMLQDNYYGPAKIGTQLAFDDRPLWLAKNKIYEFSLPINFPNGYEIEYKKGCDTFTGMYAESVDINGASAPGGRSVVTPQGIDGVGSCVMYITARNRLQFVKDGKPTGLASKNSIGNKYKCDTNISNMVLRGSPFAWAGIILAPNENMRDVNLTGITIYDVYKTLALQTVGTEIQNTTVWNNAQVNLILNDCNLRGYTVPGSGWKKITYENTTFEAGSETKYSHSNMTGEDFDHRNAFRTCKVEADTDFKKCYFKAPYYIDLSEAVDKYTVKFDECAGTSAYGNEFFKINNEGKYGTEKVYYIGIDKDVEKGVTVVTYYGPDRKEINK